MTSAVSAVGRYCGLLIRAAAVCSTVSVLVGGCVKDIPRPPDDDGGADANESGGQGGGAAGIGGQGGTGGLVQADAGPDAAIDPGRVDAMISPPDGQPPAPDMAVPTCGGNGQACCGGNACRNNGCCVAGRCSANGTPCRADATCLNGSCGGCGGSAQGCCSERMCTAARTTCTGAGAGMCQACGGVGQGCCANSFCDGVLVCDPAQMAPTGMCVACGGKGPACCAGQTTCMLTNDTCTGGKCP